MSGKQKLELTWIGKDKRPKLEPRILLEDPARSYHARQRVTDKDIFDNRLIKGDNLLALKALEAEFAGKVKCVFIDPPYNTGSAFTHYDDGMEHSLWLTMMRDRLVVQAYSPGNALLTRNGMSDAPAIYVQGPGGKVLARARGEYKGAAPFAMALERLASSPDKDAPRPTVPTYDPAKDPDLWYEPPPPKPVGPSGPGGGAVEWWRKVPVAGWGVLALGGVGLAVLFSLSHSVELSLFPFAVVLQVTPIVAIAPLILIYVDNTDLALLTCAWIVAGFPILSNTALGLNSADHYLRDLFQLYRASRWQQLTLLRMYAEANLGNAA